MSAYVVDLFLGAILLFQIRKMSRLGREVSDLKEALQQQKENQISNVGVTDLNTRLEQLQNMRFSYMRNNTRKDFQK